MSRRVMFPDLEVEVGETTPIDEAQGKLDSQSEEKLMRSVMKNDKQKIDEGKLLKDAMNQGISAFTPDVLFEHLVKNFQAAKNIYGPRLLKALTTYDANYLERNMAIPEFRHHLREVIERKVGELKKDRLLSRDGAVTEEGMQLASLVLYHEELDKLMTHGLAGEKVHKLASHYGDKNDVRNYKKGDRYRDIALKQSVKAAIRRGASRLTLGLLRSYERRAKGQVAVVYGLDCSGSMKGEKLDVAKKAGIALAYTAIDSKDIVGLVNFSHVIVEEIAPTDNFQLLLESISRARPARETNIAQAIQHAISLFPSQEMTKHLILLTDAMPTSGKKPEKDTLSAASIAKGAGITLSVVGINLSKDGEALAKKIVSIGEGRLYAVKNLDEVDRVVLEEYYSVV